MITQNNKPIAFFSGKLTGAQTRYSITEIELLAIVETVGRKDPRSSLLQATYPDVRNTHTGLDAAYQLFYY